MLDLIKDPAGSRSLERTILLADIRRLLANDQLAAGSSFVRKVFAFWEAELDACLDNDGVLDKSLFDFLYWLGMFIVADVQGVESNNSILSAITTRCKHICPDLISSRHVIKSSSEDLVPKEIYTQDSKKQCNRVANQFRQRGRFEAFDRDERPILKQMPVLPCPRAMLPQVMAVTRYINALIAHFDLLMFLVDRADARHATFGPWVVTSKFQYGLYGLLCDMESVETTEPPVKHIAPIRCGGRLAGSYYPLLTIVSELLQTLPWPIPADHGCSLTVQHAAIESRPTHRQMVFTTWTTLCEITLPLAIQTANDEDNPAKELEEVMGCDVREDDEEDDDGEDENSNERTRTSTRIPAPRARKADNFVPDVEDENPLLGPDGVAEICCSLCRWR